MKKLATVLTVLALVAAAQAGVVLSEDFESGQAGYGINGTNGWSGASEFEYSTVTIDSGQSAGWSTGGWVAISKGFSYTPGVGESYVLTAVLYAPGTSGEYADLRICNSSDPANTMQGVAIGYGSMDFGVINGTTIKVTQPTSATDVMFVLDGDTSAFYYKAHGAADWISAGGFTSLGWSIAAYDQIVMNGHGSYAGNIDTILLEAVPEPATMSLLTLGGLGVLIRRKR